MRVLRHRTSILVATAVALVTAVGSNAHEGEHKNGRVMVIASVVPDGAADKAGVIAGDQILAWNGENLTTQQELTGFLSSFRPGDEISLHLDRDGETLDLPVILGQRSDGGVSLGVSLGVAASSGAQGSTEGFSAAGCLEWVDETYRMTSLAQEFVLDLSTEIGENRDCMDRDTQRMAKPIPQTWCDNVFKVHCSGLDLLAEIGDRLVAKCEEHLNAFLEIDIGRDQRWNICGEQKVFDRYSMEGKTTDEPTCRQIFIDKCGAEIEN